MNITLLMKQNEGKIDLALYENNELLNAKPVQTIKSVESEKFSETIKKISKTYSIKRIVDADSEKHKTKGIYLFDLFSNEKSYLFSKERLISMIKRWIQDEFGFDIELDLNVYRDNVNAYIHGEKVNKRILAILFSHYTKNYFVENILKDMLQSRVEIYHIEKKNEFKLIVSD